MRIEKTDKAVIQNPIPCAESTNPLMIETPGIQIGTPKNATMPQGVPAPKAGPAPSDINVSKPPVATPA